ncbi:MAG: 30S ribosomal protein S13 [Verrucomicrobiota bacterium JB022]|nr:30S ribosomal protein S13 [Verrucomicrobiota bacterium JB022]
MPRILGVDIPGNKKIPYSLRYIYGIGPTLAEMLVEEAGLDPDARAHTLSEEDLNKIAELVLEKGIRVEGDLRREITGNLKRLQAIQCYRGVRHRKGLPVRGQRTKSNARTRKGKRRTISGKKK